MNEIPTFPPSPSHVPFILLVLVLSAFSGVAGTLLLFTLFPEFRQAQIPPGSQAIIVQQPGRIVVEEGTHFQDLENQVVPVVGQLYHPQDIVKLGLDSLYIPTKRSGIGVLLTSDGWFGTSATIGPKDVLYVNNKPYVVTKAVHDTASPYFLGKVDASNFPVAAFSSEIDVGAGMTVLGIVDNRSLYPATITNNHQLFDPSSVSEPSDSLGFGFAFSSESLPQNQGGTPIFSLSGSLLGFSGVIKSQPLVFPAIALKTMLNNQLSSDSLNRPAMGVRVLYLPDSQNGEAQGALIYAENSFVALDKKGPAAAAGLKIGDHINVINGTTLGLGRTSLFSVLERFHPGDTLTLEITRDGQKSVVSVTCGKL